MPIRTPRRLQFLPVLILLAGLLAWWGAVALAPAPDVQISKALERESLRIEHMLRQIEQVLQENRQNPFSALPQPEQYPYYIFANGTPWYWSDYHLLPPFSALLSPQPVQFLSLPDGQYLSYKRELTLQSTPYSIFVLLPLQSSMLEPQLGLRYNPDVFSGPAFSLSSTAVAGFQPLHLPNSTQPLFHIALLPGYEPGAILIKEIAAWGILLGFLGVALLFWFRGRRAALGSRAFWLYVSLFVAIRVLMLVLDLPYKVYPLRIFNPQHYASSSLMPSLGDFLLNVLFAVGSVLLLWPHRSWLMQRLERPSYARITKFGVLVFVLLVLLLHYLLMRLLFFHAQFSLDITTSISLTDLKVLAWSVVAMASLLFFLLAHPGLVWLRSQSFTRGEMIIAGGIVALAAVVLYAYSLASLLLLLAGGLYLMLYRRLQPRYPAPRLNYALFIYLFAASVVCALSASLALHSHRKAGLLLEKERLATQILTERDLVGEYLLSETSRNIQGDPFIINRFLSPLFSKEGIEQKIRRQYLGRYFDKYEVTIRLFGLDGNPLMNQPAGSYHSLHQQARQEGEATTYEGLIRLQGDGAVDYRYKQFVAVSYQGSAIGYVMLDLKLKRYQPRTVYPELFLGQQEPVFERNNYAVYLNGRLRFDAGDFDYLHIFPPQLLEDEELYEKGVFIGGYHHYAQRGEGNRIVVVSSQAQPWSFLYANFSFLLLMLLFFITAYVLLYVLYRGLPMRYLNFTTKIQLYLNFAIFLPLLIITLSTLSLISTSYRRETEQQYVETAESIGRGLSDQLREYQMGYLDRDVLNSTLDRVARFTETDIHLFDTRGMLQATSQPEIYQKNYLAPVINPQAQAEIVEQRHRQVILTETVGRLQYRSTYVAVRNNTDGQLLGILSIPFFDSGYMLQRQLSAIFSNTVSIFATLFLVLLLLLYVLSKELTAPLRYIAERLRLISLTGKNEPLSWPTEDEIGLLVREYNLMLINLQASKEALSRTEKESAWREMAKQVAHEIKNPLTPMRLNLQHLSRRLQHSLDGEQQEKVNRSFQSILDQIDTLSDIATSFSTFAQMPVLRQDQFDVAELLRKVVRLYANEQASQIHAQIADGQWMVQGDEQLMQRTFNNLILNGIQAVPPQRTPLLQVSLQAARSGGKVLIKIKDNGSGIPETIRNKVFVPNFSTKSSGSGLGLAIAKRGIEHAGGSIWFDSHTETQQESRSDEAGTTFFMELPLVT
ncbi:sensor histidine kinase [Cesiribacter andamanensis]|uniref:histidine kinase n=1 Tax=Cesiribacter andamanensis AMV16 TaxID=1279009 RepID=M7N2W7_9BACT|nr:ATP-binding protein [Cesiribacter andamanensis]EMR03023.1 Sensor protein ZraS [Cesiribacter andamanensis AMV16]